VIRILNGLSHLGAAWLASKIGLVRTMVFTHLPSSLFLRAVPLAPTFGIAAVLLLMREALVGRWTSRRASRMWRSGSTA
jgi:hypothetical protein